MNSGRRTAALPAVGFPIRTPPDQSLVSGSPKLFAATRVLPRLLSPRHPSCALCSLVIVSSSSTFSPRRPRSNAVLLPGLTGRSPALLSLHLRICNFQRPVLQKRCLVAPLARAPRRRRAEIGPQELRGSQGASEQRSRRRAAHGPPEPDRQMELIGIEPMTSSLQSWRSTN